jgi:5-methylcytosine-specific restriction endonuclease McrA
MTDVATETVQRRTGRCTAITANGLPCWGHVGIGSNRCINHRRQCLCGGGEPFKCSRCRRTRVLHFTLITGSVEQDCPRARDASATLSPWHGNKRRRVCDPCWRTLRPRVRPAISQSQRAAVPPGPCVYCGNASAATIDHVVPLAQAGGHHAANFVRACKSCNSSKGKRTPEQWLASGGGPDQWTLFAKFAADIAGEPA